MKKSVTVPLLTLLIGVNLGLWGRTLFPEKVKLENLYVEGTFWRGQKIIRTLGPNEIIIKQKNNYLSLDEALQSVPEELGRRDLARQYIKAGSVKAVHQNYRR